MNRKKQKLQVATQIGREILKNFEFEKLKTINYVEVDGVFMNFTSVSTEEHFNSLVKRVKDAKGRIMAKFRMQDDEYIYWPKT